jgi:hypothetical protein
MVDTLVRRQRRRFEPITRAGGWFGANTLALLMVALACGQVLQLTGVWKPEPLTRQDDQRNLIYDAVFAVFFAGFAVWAWLQQPGAGKVGFVPVCLTGRRTRQQRAGRRAGVETERQRQEQRVPRCEPGSDERWVARAGLVVATGVAGRLGRSRRWGRRRPA